MGEEPRGGVFDNALMLHSEHKRILGDAIKRGDEKCREAETRGYYAGIAIAAWGSVIVALIAMLAGFNFGLSFVQ